MKVQDLRPGDRVRALNVPWGVTKPKPRPGEVGVCFAERNAYGDRNGPMVRFTRGGVCNVYEGWVKPI